MDSPSRHTRGRLPAFLPGDVVLCPCAKDDRLGQMIRSMERVFGESPTYATHTAQFLDGHTVLEMNYTVKIRTLEQFLRMRRGLEVWRMVPLTASQREALTRKALSYVNARFGVAKLLTHLLDGLINKLTHKEVFLFRRLNHSDRYPICSWITAFTYHRVLNYEFGVPPECADPDQIHDWVKGHPDEWARVFSLEKYLQRRRRPAGTRPIFVATRAEQDTTHAHTISDRRVPYRDDWAVAVASASQLAIPSSQSGAK